MGALDTSEEIRISDLLSTMQDAISGGRFPADVLNVMQPYAISLRSRLEQLTVGEDGLSAEEKEKKAKNAEVLIAGASYNAQISHYSEHGFKNETEFFDFSANFEDKEFMKTFEALPEEEKINLANKMGEARAALSPERRAEFDKERPGALGVIEQYADRQYTVGLSKGKEGIAEITSALESLNSEQGAKQGRDLIDKNESLDEAVIARHANGTAFAEIDDKRVERMSSATNLSETIHDVAQENEIASHREEYENKKNDLQRSFQGLSPAELEKADLAARELKEKGGEVQDKDNVELPQIAQSQKSSGMDMSFLS